MIIMGLHKDPWHNTGAAIIKDDGETVQFAFVSEERLDRIKDSRNFPIKSINACMRQLGIASVDEIDLIVLDYIENPDWRKDNKQHTTKIDSFLAGFPEDKIIVMDHHLAHACATFYSSPFESAAVLIIDGRGSSKETQSLFRASLHNSKIELLEKTDKMGIGLLYATMTQKIGFGLMQEGKTMGLAPYGRSREKAIYQFPHHYKGIVTDYSEVMIEGTYNLTASYERQIETFEDKAAVAYDIQCECEEAMLHLAKYAKEQTGENFLCLSGGVALNSVTNNKILKSDIFEDIFINPACSDTGIPLGCALYGYHIIKKMPKKYDAISPYLGIEYSDDDIQQAIQRYEGFRVIEKESFQRVVELLCSNKIVACHQGRSEMGPRALGNRSILMSPMLAENKDVLNRRVKHREAFRPFAPAVLEEFAHEYFDLDRPSPYMLLVPDVRADKRDIIPAITHVDGTARVQTLTRERNKHFYKIVEAFYGKSGVPVLLNTSFNVAGEPIVESPDDAIRCFLGTDIDALFIGNYLLEK